MLDPAQTLAMALDPALILRAMSIDPDPWQRNLLLSADRQVLLLCSRGAGKSRTVSALALHTALFQPKSLVLLLSRAERQSMELFRYVKEAYRAVGRPVALVKETETQCEFANGSRIVSLPGKEETIRSLQGVALLVIDEAARVPDDLYRSVRPMLAVSRGRLIALTTPFGQRGWFFDEWERKNTFHKVRIPWNECPRISPVFIAEEKASMGEMWVNQEYECLFTALEGLVYPDFGKAVVDLWPLPTGKPVGGIDFGWRNPFAALWGVLDRDDVLWIGWERYLRQTPLHEHAAALPRPVMWYCDPAGATETAELRAAGLTARAGDNDIRLGVAAVAARIRTGRLKILSTACWNLIAESKLYRYPANDERSVLGEKPVDDHNHALGALRYLISKLDYKFIARLRKTAPREGPIESDSVETAYDEQLEETHRAVYGARTWDDFKDDDDLWTKLS